MYYKFRDFRNYKYTLDILLNQKSYSASFRNLNDNFEGQFFSDTSNEFLRYRLNQRNDQHLSICSFSKDYKSHLLWSHCADGHRGFVIGFDIDESKYDIAKVNYNGLSIFPHLPTKPEDLKAVFLNKLKDWSYEEEYRIITAKQEYVDIRIKKIIFGYETSTFDKEIITKLAKLIDSDIVIESYYE